MGTPTYLPIETVTLTATSSSVTFSNIPQTFRDLVLVVNSSNTGTAQLFYRVNNDSSSIYREVFMSGSGTATSSRRDSDRIIGNFNVNDSTSNISVSILQIMDYTTTDKHKSFLLRTNNSAVLTAATAARYASTSAINRLDVSVSSGSFTVGSTFTLYGIEG